MQLRPYEQVDDTPFAACVQDILAAHGAPAHRGRNACGLDELDYGAVVYRFQPRAGGARLEEVTRRAPVLHLGTLAVPFAALGGFVRAQDAAAFERAGFLVSPRFGLAFVPGMPCWVTALARHCLGAWRAL